MVDRLRAGAARRRLPDRGAGLQSAGDRPHAERRRSAHGDRARRAADRRARMANPHFRQVRQAAPVAPDQLLRDRRPRNGGLRPRSRFRRHACRDGVRPGAQHDLRPQPPAALGARRPRRDVLFRRQPGRRRRTRRLRGFAHPFPRRRIAHQPDRLRALALAEARRRRQAVAVRSGRQLHARIEPRAQWLGRSRIRRRARRQRRLGGRACRPAARQAADPRGRIADPFLRDPRGRALARPADPLAVRDRARRPKARPDPSHAAPLGACDGQRTRHGDDGVERRRDLLRLRQRPAERADRLPLRQRDRRAARAGRLPARPRRRARPTRRASPRSSGTTPSTRSPTSRAWRRSARGAATSRWNMSCSFLRTGRATSGC